MKTIILILVVVALSSAAPKPTKLQFRNLYKQPKQEIKNEPRPRIIGGKEAQPNEFPYQVFLEVYTSGKGWYCGGSLISQNYVLTAGHCADQAVLAAVTLGAHHPKQNESTQLVLYTTIFKLHENFSLENILNDIALIELPYPVNFTNAVQPIPLPYRSSINNTFENSTGVISGWGLTDGFDDVISDVLNYVDATVMSNLECTEYFSDLKDTNICTSGDQDTGVCEGDSGGPLVVNGTQVGIVSYGIILCLDGFPSVYTRVTSYLDWIQKKSQVLIK